jgi:predicted amidohydrolase
MVTRIAVVQTDPGLGSIKKNLDRMEALIRSTTADLLVFPECAVTGYGFSTKDDAWNVAETIPGPSSERIAVVAKERGSYVVYGCLERCENALFNTAVLMGPEGLVGIYRKMHLPFMGADRFATPGDLGFPVFETPIGRLGLLICFDLSFPEAARSLKLGGAQILVVPTNWPAPAEVSCLMSPTVRAHENHLFVVTANRVGEEAGFRFRGESRICNTLGTVLAVASNQPGVITADVEPASADDHRQIIIPKEYEIDRISTRRPLFYDRLTMTRAELADQGEALDFLEEESE